jgi:hypothetical protein
MVHFQIEDASADTRGHGLHASSAWRAGVVIASRGGRTGTGEGPGLGQRLAAARPVHPPAGGRGGGDGLLELARQDLAMGRVERRDGS